jgi:hypothetical protein
MEKDTDKNMNRGCCDEEIDEGNQRLLSDKELDLVTGGTVPTQQTGAQDTGSGQAPPLIIM